MCRFSLSAVRATRGKTTRDVSDYEMKAVAVRALIDLSNDVLVTCPRIVRGVGLRPRRVCLVPPAASLLLNLKRTV